MKVYRQAPSSSILIKDTQDRFEKTKSAVITFSVMSVPLLAAYNFLPVILYRDLGATPLQITLFFMLKPLAALFSLYWSSFATDSKKLIPNVVWSGIFARLPFLLFPFVQSPLLVIIAWGNYWLFSRGGIPAWMEILKRNLPEEERGKIFSRGSAIGYVKGPLLALLMGILMDRFADIWRLLFPLCAIVGIVAVVIQSKVELEHQEEVFEPVAQSFKQRLLDPWKQSFELLKSNTQFKLFQIGFMICGFGMIVIQPALPIFFVDVLGVSYTELAFALGISKGLGFALTAPIWSRALTKVSVFHFSSLIFFLVALFPLFLASSSYSIALLYVAYCLYGIAQAGSELCWHMSGPMFSKKENSALYSSVNVSSVGVRGLFAPPLGSLLASFLGAFPLFIFGAALSLVSAYFMRSIAFFSQSKEKAIL